ncbi:MAG TPA: class I SAM-dependent methyltransferase [Solirubrobacteraceae bacterium]
MLYEERTRAESFGEVAELYDRARPSYPPALLDALLAGEPQPHAVLDIACGTGIAGALFAARGCAVLGVELDARMAALARARGLDVEVAPFEAWEPAGRSFELAICAQAWHWLEPHAALAKAASALEPGATLAVFWNFGDPPADVAARLRPIYARLEPELENYSALLGHYRDRGENALATVSADEAFEQARARRFEWSKRYDTAGWLDFLQTHSDHQTLAPERLRRLLDDVARALEQLGGAFEMSYATTLISARRR